MTKYFLYAKILFACVLLKFKCKGDFMKAEILSALRQVKKRNGEIIAFDQVKITNAILKAMEATTEGNIEDAQKVSNEVAIELKNKYRSGGIPDIEEIQNIVEKKLVVAGFFNVTRAYIVYREKRAELRSQIKEIPEEVKVLARESKKYFRNALGEFIGYLIYARWIPEKGRRETYIETVGRYIDFMRENLGTRISDEDCSELYQAILKQEVLPSMRLLWSAGLSAKATNVAAYNCSYIAITKIRDFGEILYISMCGTGVGFSVEEKAIQNLPQIKMQTGEVLETHFIGDSKEGWADALILGLTTWFSGRDINFDFSHLRPAGARLKTMGGKSSGPAPLRSLLNFCRDKILSRQGRRLSTINVHDIACKIGECVVMGGVRRSALISLSDLDDLTMRDAKKGQFYNTNPERSMANNSTIFNSKPSSAEFLEEWLALIKSGSGERGIFNRGSLVKQLPNRRLKVIKSDLDLMGTNPCGEIDLVSKQFCNLSEIVARTDDTRETLLRKIKLATILGTYQSTLTDFPYISEEWKQNCEKERLLGVSITGQWDCPVVRDKKILKELKLEAIRTNQLYSAKFGINPSTCITCIKPSGNGSQLIDASSGMHPRHAKYYIRRVRISPHEALFKMLKDQKVPYHPEVGQIDGLASVYVVEFPIKAPENSVTKNDLTAIEQLEYWKMVKLNYTEHNPSVTISVGDDEWITVSNWLYENWDILGGLSFLPREDHVYQLAPYEEITEEQYNKLIADFPDIDFSQILSYEKSEDYLGRGAQELACAADSCEVR